jgi:uncharacterized protein (DUF4415 family)
LGEFAGAVNGAANVAVHRGRFTQRLRVTTKRATFENEIRGDEGKDRRNVAKHGLSVEDAEQVFSGPCVTFEGFDYGEERLVTLGLLRGIAVNKKSIKSDLARIDRMRDADIDYSDIPPLDKTFLKKAASAWPPAKRQLTIRLDANVLDWLKGHGKGYQTRINRILRVVMESQPPAPQ